MNPLGQRRIALVGGAGFIGHSLALALARRGADVSIVDSLRVNNLVSLANADATTPNRTLYLEIARQRQRLLREASIPVYTQDARDQQALGELITMIQPQVLIHLAGISHADRSNQQPHEAFDHTLYTLENTLAAARDGVEHFIFFSSSMVYGNFRSEAVTELSPCEPLGVYGALKYSGERLVIAHGQVFDLPYTIVRPAALYGPRCVSRRVAQVFVENALQGRELCVAGSGDSRLDFTYIDDLIQGVCRIIERDESRGEVFNLTFGASRSIEDLIDQLRTAFPELEVKHTPKDRFTPNRGTLCVDKARALLDYEPRWPIERGLDEYIAWYRRLFTELHIERGRTHIETMTGDLAPAATGA